MGVVQGRRFHDPSISVSISVSLSGSINVSGSFQAMSMFQAVLVVWGYTCVCMECVGVWEMISHS